MFQRLTLQVAIKARASCSVVSARKKILYSCARALSTTSLPHGLDLFNPTEEHLALREMVRSFAESEVEPQALEYNNEERFNKDLFKRCGELGL